MKLNRLKFISGDLINFIGKLGILLGNMLDQIEFCVGLRFGIRCNFFPFARKFMMEMLCDRRCFVQKKCDHFHFVADFYQEFYKNDARIVV